MSELKNQYNNEDEIDLIELLKKIYIEKRFIIKSSIITAVVGVLFALIQPNQYTSSTTFIPCLLYTSPSPRDRTRSRMPSSA